MFPNWPLSGAKETRRQRVAQGEAQAGQFGKVVRGDGQAMGNQTIDIRAEGAGLAQCAGDGGGIRVAGRLRRGHLIRILAGAEADNLGVNFGDAPARRGRVLPG